jgi:hypothetical protein
MKRMILYFYTLLLVYNKNCHLVTAVSIYYFRIFKVPFRWVNDPLVSAMLV